MRKFSWLHPILPVGIFAAMLGILFVGCPTATEPETVSVTGVTLDSMKLTLKIGESVLLKATVSPSDATDKTVKWSSKDESVATVDEYGNVTAVGEGGTMIIVETVNGGFSAGCDVWVTVSVSEEPTPDVSVTGINLNITELNLKINQMEQLIATVYPEDATNKNVSWNSSDESVAIVDIYGNVTAVGKGNAYIIVRTADGGFSARCEVTVTQDNNPGDVPDVPDAPTTGDYTVKYFYEIIDDEYTENIDERKTKTGTIGMTTIETADAVQGFEQPVITQATIVENEENVVIVKYARKTITLTLDLDGGTGTTSISGKYGASVTKPDEPIRTGYTFANWNPDLPENFPIENATYKALWTENSLIITVALPTQAEIPQLEYIINDNIVTLTAEAGHSTYAWFIDMKKQDESTNTLKINAADLSSGFYSVMVVIDGKYSSTAMVTIDN